MKKEKLIPLLVSFIMILECLGIIIIKLVKIGDFEIEFGDSISVIFFTFFSYIFVMVIIFEKYKSQTDELL